MLLDLLTQHFETICTEQVVAYSKYCTIICL